jgi:ABC-type multidrug transport system permease subunit
LFQWKNTVKKEEDTCNTLAESGFIGCGTILFEAIEAIPTWLRPASCLVPSTYAVDACRDIMLRRWGLEKIWVDIVALVMFASLFLIAAVLSLRRRG